MKNIVQFSGGKDSQATLIWTCKKYGPENILAVYCDTKWENPITYDHINAITKQLGVQLIVLTSSKYDGMIGMVKEKGRFPSTNARFCTEELKIIPFIDYLMDQVKDNVIIYQGIRGKESESRSKMNQECRLFKYYFEPYQTNSMIVVQLEGKAKTIKQKRKLAKAKKRLALGKEDPKFHTYRKEDVFEWCKKYDDSLLRPFFEATAQEVIDYILDNGQQPNPLYGKGYSRVGCFPCIMSTHSDIKQTIRYFPETLEDLIKHEVALEASFFGPDYIPKHARSNTVIRKRGKKRGKEAQITLTGDVIKYLNGKWATLDMFDPGETKSCMSMYNSVCE